MKKYLLYIFITSFFLSSNISFSMQPSLSLSTREMCILAIGFGCGMSLCMAYNYKDTLIHLVHSMVGVKMVEIDDSKKNDSQNGGIVWNKQIQKQEQKQQNDELTLDRIELITANRKKREKIANGEDIPEDSAMLCKACLQNNVKEVRRLLQQSDIDINAKYSVQIKGKRYYDTCTLKQTALLIACRQDNKEIINELLKHKDIDVAISDDADNTALSYACKHNGIAMIQQLLKHPTMQLNSSLSLSTACCNGHIDIVQLLLRHNKDNCMRINNALLKVCIQINTYVMKCRAFDIIIGALSNNISLDVISNWRIFNETPYYKAVECLYEKKNQNYIATAQQETKKYADKRAKSMQIIRMLLDDSYIDFKPIMTTNTIFHAAAADEELLQLLLQKNELLSEDKKCSIDVWADNSSFACTPLYAAVVYNNIINIQVLIEKGADISKEGRYCHETCTPFLLLCTQISREKSGSPDLYKNIMEYFLTLPAVNQDKEQLSEGLCHLACSEKQCDDLCVSLLRLGVDPNKKNQYGGSILSRAAGWKKLSLLNVCIDQYGGDIFQQNNNQNTIFYLYMSHKTQPDDINYIKQLNSKAKTEFMERELTIVANSCPKKITLSCSCPETEDAANSYINRLNNFIATCIKYGKIDIHKITIEDNTLLDIAYKNAQKRLVPGYYAHGYEKKFLAFNDVIVHALLPYYNDDHLSNDQKIDKQIVKAYKKSPALYYLKKQEEKDEVKKSVVECFENV
jgi:ankyrin repeat protein